MPEEPMAEGSKEQLLMKINQSFPQHAARNIGYTTWWITKL